MLRRTHLSQALVFCLVLGTFATLYPIRNATEQLNNQEASAEDTTAPTFSAAAVNSAGTQVIVGFSEALSATTASLSAFSISVNGESRTPTAMSIVGSTVVLTTSPAITAGQTVTFSYTDPSAGNDANAIQDSSGNDASSIATTSVSNHVVTSSLSLGSNHSCAVTSTGGVKCWGYGYYGQLGINASGAFSDRTTPVDVTEL
jgi:uncharacterized repeat protein (TIGR02059 family)